MQNCSKNTEFFNTIIIGGGAAGLYAAARLAGSRRPGREAPGTAPSILLLEKTSKTGMKLLMSGAGQCNLTHAGSIKEFLSCYGEKGPRIRTCLYQHNNLAVQKYFTDLGVPLTEREDGKIFPASMDARQVRDALVREAERGGAVIRTGIEVTGITALSDLSVRYRLSAMDGRYWDCRNLLIATGGCSYPSTGSDGSMLKILNRDLGLEIVPPAPALTPVFVENYPFAELSGISFPDAGITLKERIHSTAAASAPRTHTSILHASGGLLLTHRNFSGPVILNNARYMKTGMGLEINFLFPYTIDTVVKEIKKDSSAAPEICETWLAEKYGLPKRFCEAVLREIGLSRRKRSTLSTGERKTLAEAFSAMQFTISGLAGFGQAMVTAGGVSLSEVDLKTMEAKDFSGLYLAGEVLDIDGDTGGYNLQFAFASAAAAAKTILQQDEKE